ncbi:zinc-ribbon domain-containing protein [Actinomadura parmotrematis]|uniref:Zinc-ribbon 15 domain-containing protein n=1 Tax=Actinomadura parmotrematis TaxID=2864039 RepID=A0ABS7FTM1_9ACTN|nr:zinc-ribbon domain-containing protein [Actinomadura parmotrematis]MBW8483535.1 hypothetical protein [Actinomadura parmotrematis]
MLLVFGVSVFFRTDTEGTFHCPRCGGDRGFRRRRARRWITLFFVPVVPLDRRGEAVECRACRTRFGDSVLRVPTARRLAAVLPAGMRAAAALVLRAGDPAHPAALERTLEAVRGYGDTGHDEAAVRDDLTLRQGFLEEEVARAGAVLTVEGREWLFAKAVRIGLAGGPLSDAERRALHGVADRLGLSPAHALGVIVATEGAAR